MPEVFRTRGYVFRFYSNERNEPPHIHVFRADAEAKFWLLPVRLEYSYGYTSRQLRFVEEIIRERHVDIMRRWNEHIENT
jgi:hypothetical protein